MKDPSNVPKRNGNVSTHKALHLDVHSSILLIDEKWKQSKCSSIDINVQIKYITMEYYSSIKNKRSIDTQFNTYRL